MPESVLIFQKAMYLVVILSAPALAVAVIAGLLISLIQALLSLQEQTLPFSIKLVAVAAVLALTARWMGNEIVALSMLCYDYIREAGNK